MSARRESAILLNGTKPETVRAIEEEFAILSARWRHETRGNSCFDEWVEHPDYQRIIGLGIDVVPLLLRELKSHPFRWLYALHQITGEDPSRGCRRVDDIAEAWSRWGKEKGYL